MKLKKECQVLKQHKFGKLIAVKICQQSYYELWCTESEYMHESHH